MNRIKFLPILCLLACLFVACFPQELPQAIDSSNFTATIASKTETGVVLSCQAKVDESLYSSIKGGIFYAEDADHVRNNQRVKRVMGSNYKDGKFTVSLKNLSAGKVYYYKVWLQVDEKHYLFGNVKSFSTQSAKENGYDYVDLGLPSGTVWASVNLGAESETEAGNYYAWGELTPKDYYGEDNYSAMSYQNEFLPYSMDAARYQWGGRWRMPSAVDWDELLSHCEVTFLKDYSTSYGYYLITGQNGKSIKIPLGGYRIEGEGYEDGYLAYQWTGQLQDPQSAYSYVLVNDGSWHLGAHMRSVGFNIRPVFKNETAYVVRYDANGGYGEMPEQLKAGNDTYVMEENMFARENHSFTGWNTAADGSGMSLQPGEWGFDFAEDITFYAQWKRDNTGTDNGYAYIDLGLPSGTIWATCNVGASAPDESGLYFAWGETFTKDNYAWSTYSFGNNYDAITKYCNNDYYGYNGFVDNILQLEPTDDAATQIMGHNWRTPTYEEMRELIDECYWTWTSNGYGVYGYEVASPYNGNRIFLPAGGYYNESSLNQEMSVGNYWTSSLYEENPANANLLKFNSSEVMTDRFYRYYGENIRAVYTGEIPEEPGADFCGTYTATGTMRTNAGDDTTPWTVTITQDASDPSVFYVNNLHNALAVFGVDNALQARYDAGTGNLVVSDKQYLGSTDQYAIYTNSIILSGGSWDLLNQDYTLSRNDQGQLVLSCPIALVAYDLATHTSNVGYFSYVRDVVLTKNGGSGNQPDTPDTPDGTFDVSGTSNGFDFVDLGLSVNWAVSNLGASTPLGSGWYYAWGEVGSKNDYSWDTYIFGNPTSGFVKYNDGDGLLVLEPSEDAATYNMGGNWRMPTYEEMEELRSQCSWTWASIDGVNGYLVTGPSNKTLFLPTPGYYDGTELLIYGTHGLYWTSSLSPNYKAGAFHLNYGEGEGVSIPHGDRFYGRSVRAVLPRESGETPDASSYATIYFNGSGALGSMSSMQVEIGVPTKLPKLGFTMQDHDFVCWALSPEGGDICYEDEAYITADGDMTLYAIWNWYYISTGQENGHLYVDLGLPSGIKWASYNLGSPEPYSSCADYGKYYAWGETSTKDDFSWDTYQFGTQNALHKYTTSPDYDADPYYDGRTQLDASDDVAHVEWGGRWHIPTQTEMSELLNNCTWIETVFDGVKGFRVKGPNGRSIFLPAAGSIIGRDSVHTGTGGSYWTSTLNESPNYGAICCDFGSTKGIYYSSRSNGRPVRPVFSDEAPTNYQSVQFNPNGGSGQMQPLLIQEGTSGILPENTFTHADANAVFIGWSTSADGNGTLYTAGSEFPWHGQDMMLYAQWQQQQQQEPQLSVSGQYNNFDYVDLGLPSGLKWATCNVGAAMPSAYGNYYMWGDVQAIDLNWGMHVPGLENYPYYKDGRYTKYLMYQQVNLETGESFGNIDKKNQLMTNDDAAHVSMGGNWRMPTLDNVQELIDNCTREYISVDGVPGVKYVGPNNNSIFFPCTGCYIDGALQYEGTTGDYWTSRAEDENVANAFYMTVRAKETYEQIIYSNSRAQARPIRAVYHEEENIVDEFTVTYFANGGEDDYNGDIFWQDFAAEEMKALVDIDADEASPLFWRDGHAFAGWNSQPDGSGTYYAGGSEVALTRNVALYAQWIPVSGKLSSYYYVDLGLPSGIKWAAYNVGTDSPYEYGDYFAWGETTPKTEYSWNTYKYGGTEDNIPTKYNSTDGLVNLEASDDAARANWGGRAWRMPTQAEQEELINNCTWTWTTQNGVNGYTVTSKTNGNSIFLPAAGRRIDTFSVDDVGSHGDYWSSSLSEIGPDYACFLYFYSGYVNWSYYSRFYGRTVRAVCP